MRSLGHVHRTAPIYVFVIDIIQFLDAFLQNHFIFYGWFGYIRIKCG